MSPKTQYARSQGVFIAYQTFGQGPRDIVVVPGFVSNVEWYWNDPKASRWLHALSRLGRVTIFDKRGTGLSDRVADLPDMNVRKDDMRAVMDAVGIQRAVLLGVSEGGSMAIVFAAQYPERCEALVLVGAFARFTSWFATAESLQCFLDYIETAWGNGGIATLVAPSLAKDPHFLDSVGKFERQGGSPTAVIALMRMNSLIDITEVLSDVSAPTLVIHKTGDTMVSVEGGRTLAAGIAGAKLFEMSGVDHLPWNDDCVVYLAEIEDFLTGQRSDWASESLSNTPFEGEVATKGEAILTGRQRQILSMLATGLTCKEVARRLHLSESTVREHASNCYRRLDARNRAQAIDTSRRLGLLG